MRLARWCAGQPSCIRARVSAQGGDFFDALPAADIYVLSWILHDWDDAASARILSGIAAATAPATHLVIIEMITPPGDEPTKLVSDAVAQVVLTDGRV
ncbi:MAG: hypothetical protein JO272_06665 [Pseudonocardiales bacterium]|nr:hypothetical protein [Pseudonocardiales bacterium]